MRANFREIRCVRCGTPLHVDVSPGAGTPVALFNGCPKCAEEEIVSNLTVEMDLSPLKPYVASHGALPTSAAPGLWRHEAMLPVDPAFRTTMGEGNTPLLKLERFGARIGLPELYVKDESRLPTWSYKDRLSAVAVAKARELGAKVITVSSTGNHGASTAAYAARAGLPCVVFTTTSVPDVMKTLMQSYGAYVVAVEQSWDRWKLMSAGVREHGWYPTSGFIFPPMGSNPFGTEGYKSIAYETHEQLGRTPDFVSVPTCFGDGILGVWKGWRDLHELGIIKTAPRMIGAEVFGSLEATLRSAAGKPVEMDMRPTPAFSIATPIGTQQALLALRESNGIPCGVPETDLLQMQQQLARDEGIYAEASAIVSLASLARLRQEGRLKEDDTVVAVLTSTGLKDPQSTARELPPVPVVAPEMSEVRKALRDTYKIDLF